LSSAALLLFLQNPISINRVCIGVGFEKITQRPVALDNVNIGKLNLKQGRERAVDKASDSNKGVYASRSRALSPYSS